MLNEKKSVSKDDILYDSIYIKHSQKDKIIEMENRFVVVGLAMGVKGVSVS